MQKDGEADKEEGTLAGKCKKDCDKEEAKEEGTLAGKCKKSAKTEIKKKKALLPNCFLQFFPKLPVHSGGFFFSLISGFLLDPQIFAGFYSEARGDFSHEFTLLALTAYTDIDGSKSLLRHRIAKFTGTNK